MKKTIIAISSLSLAACVYTPVAMQIEGTGEAALLGEAGGGGFELENLDGLECEGTYNLLSGDKVLITDIECSDGRTGKVQVVRTGRNLTNGSGVGRLSDGSTVKILLGDNVHNQLAKGVYEKVDAK